MSQTPNYFGYQEIEGENAEPSRKRARTEVSENGGDYARIGQHVDEPGLPAFAKFDRAGRVQLRVFKEGISEDIQRRWNTLTKNSKIASDQIVLDKEVFESYAGELEEIDKEGEDDTYHGISHGKAGWETNGSRVFDAK